MFKPQINVSLTRKKTAQVATDEVVTDTINKINWERIATLTQETSKKVAVIAVVSYAAKKVIDTTSEITIAAATAKFNN